MARLQYALPQNPLYSEIYSSLSLYFKYCLQNCFELRLIDFFILKLTYCAASLVERTLVLFSFLYVLLMVCNYKLRVALRSPLLYKCIIEYIICRFLKLFYNSYPAITSKVCRCITRLTILKVLRKVFKLL